MLSEMACRNAKASSRIYKLTDGGGLHLEITPKGQRYWCIKYRICDKEKHLSFGPYPSVSLLEAKAEREKAKALIRNRVDPGIIKQEEKRLATIKDAQTFEMVARDWHKEKSKEVTSGYAEDILHRLEKGRFFANRRLPD